MDILKMSKIRNPKKVLKFPTFKTINVFYGLATEKIIEKL